MTHPLTPREKVARIVDPEAFDHPTVHPQHLVARRAVSFSKADAILTALASGSGDHAELALMANAALEIYSDDVLVVGGTRRIHADNIILYVKNGVDALLAENAALRAMVENAADGSMGQTDKLLAMHERATEAGRKLAEAYRTARQFLAATSGTTYPSNHPMWAAIESAQQLLSKEAERG